jgi:hypothetical protein
MALLWLFVDLVVALFLGPVVVASLIAAASISAPRFRRFRG